MVEAILHELWSVHGAVILFLVFVLPLLESSTLLGVVVPGETTIILGGVLAAYGKVSIAAVLVAASVGAIAGDSLGYWVGTRWGERSVKSRLGRVVGERRWERARRHLRRKGFATVLLGRFPPAVRSLVPILSGMARMPYPRFLAGNVAGGLLWAGGSAALGYFAAGAWRKVDAVHTVVGVGMGALLIAAVVVLVVRARRRRAARARAQLDQTSRASTVLTDRNPSAA
jgi:membrane protein DedA with SNARE-associated domain